MLPDDCRALSQCHQDADGNAIRRITVEAEVDVYIVDRRFVRELILVHRGGRRRSDDPGHVPIARMHGYPLGLADAGIPAAECVDTQDPSSMPCLTTKPISSIWAATTTAYSLSPSTVPTT
jgi:hypothetical protein